MIVEARPNLFNLAYKNGLNNSNAIFFGRPHSCNFKSGPTTITDLPELSTRFPSKFCLNLPCLPFNISAKDLRGLLPVPVITLPRLPLSNNASTDSWSILFSFLTIISGALRSINLLRRLFLFITLLYKSFKSDVANLPPSKGTSGLSSGGITGTTVIIIHSGFCPVSIKDSISFSLLIALSSLTLDFVSFM